MIGPDALKANYSAALPAFTGPSHYTLRLILGQEDDIVMQTVTLPLLPGENESRALPAS